MRGETVADCGVNGGGAVNASRVVVAVALGKELQQVQRAALALVGRDVLENGGWSAVLRDDDRAAAFGGSVDEVSGAALERRDGLDVLGEMRSPLRGLGR